MDKKLEALLFMKGEPVKIDKLAKILETDKNSLKASLERISRKYDGGVVLVEKDDEVMFGTTPETSEFMEKYRKEELTRDIGKAGLETLAIVAYYGPISRKNIDYIRGVNSSFIVRHLMIRGLVERVPDEKDQRSFLYKPTIDLISYLGIKKVSELPEFEKVKTDLAAWSENAQKDNAEQNQNGDQT